MMHKKDFRWIKNLSKIFLLVFLSAVVFSANSLKAQSSGHIQGKVVDKVSGEALLGATLVIQGTAVGTSSDIEGEYRIPKLAPGKYQLVVSYIGYKKQIIPVEITSGKTVVVNVKMESEYVEGKEIVVTGQLLGQAQAINQQISSDQIVNVVSAEKIKELPDANAAEAIGRLPGVAVRRDGGEATSVFVRGLDAKFTNVTLNGIQVPASDAGARSVDLSMFSQNSLSGIELYKALTPDQDADAIAGAVNLVTGQAKADQKISADIYGLYNGLDKTFNQYKASAQYSNRFFDNFLGVQANIQAEKRIRSRETFSDSWSVPADLDYKISGLTVEYNKETRKRYGGDLTLDINTDDGGNLKFINIYSKTTRKQFRSSRDYPAVATVDYNTKALDSDIYTFNNSLVGQNHLFGALKVDWSLSHAYTKSESPFEFDMQFQEDLTDSTGTRRITDVHEYKLPGKNLIHYAYNNFKMAKLYKSYFTKTDNDERNYDVKVDLEYPVRLSDNFSGFVKGGYKYRNKNRHRNNETYYGAYLTRSSYDYYKDGSGNIVKKDWANSYWASGYTGKLTQFLGGQPYETRNINDEYILNPVINEDYVRAWKSLNINGCSADGLMKEFNYLKESVRDIYSIKENVHGSYLMVKMNAGSFFSIIAGVRYESENNDYSAKYAPIITGYLEGQVGKITDTTSTYKKDIFLPNIHIKISPLEWWDIRFAANKTISRPDFNMRIPKLYINRDAQEIETGNPNLKTATSINFDVNNSFYDAQYGLFTISGFYKKIDNIFYWLNDIKIMKTTQARELGLPVDKYGPFNGYTVDIPVNSSGTKVWGYELDLQTHLSFLPGELKNIVVGANYARTWSKTKYPRFKVVNSTTFPPTSTPVYFDEERTLIGQADYTGNISIGYDYEGFSGRFSVYFQGPYLAEVNSAERLDKYQKSFSRYDIALKQSITDYIDVFLNVNNITNVIEGNYLRFKDLDCGGSLFGTTADLGLKITLDRLF